MSVEKAELLREAYQVTIERDDASGTVTYEEWRQDGKLHRVGSPAIIKRDPSSGSVTYEAWYRKGWPHGAVHRPASPDPR